MGISNFFGSGGSKSTSTSYLPVQAQWMANILPQYGQMVGAGMPVYGGARVAEMTPQQQEALDVGGWANYLAPGNLPMFAQTSQALGGLLAGETGAQPYTPEAIDTLFRAAYEQPAKKQWSQFVQPQIREAYAGPGFWSSSRMEAERRGAQDLGDWLGEQYGNLTWQAEEANRAIAEAKAGRALSAIGLGQEQAMIPTRQAREAVEGRGALYGLTTAEQQQAQNEINANIQMFVEKHQITDPQVLEVLLPLLTANFTYSKNVEKGKGLGFNFANEALGTVGQGVGLGISGMIGV